MTRDGKREKKNPLEKGKGGNRSPRRAIGHANKKKKKLYGDARITIEMKG